MCLSRFTITIYVTNKLVLPNKAFSTFRIDLGTTQILELPTIQGAVGARQTRSTAGVMIVGVRRARLTLQHAPNPDPHVYKKKENWSTYALNICS